MTAAITERTNEEWLCRLRDAGHPGEVARGELRLGLEAALRRGIGARVGDQAEDFAQDATLRVLEVLDSFRGESRFLSWATSIAVRLALSELRRARWKDVSLDALLEVDAEPLEVAPRADAEHALARARILAALDTAIRDVLTPRQRSVIAGELRGVPQDVLASELGTNRNALYKVGHDARKVLLGALAAEGIDAGTLRWVFETGDTR